MFSYLRESFYTKIDYVIPTHPLIGAVAGFVGYYSHGWMTVYLPQVLVRVERAKYQAIFGWFASFAPTAIEQQLNLIHHASNFGSSFGSFCAPISLPTTITFIADNSHIIAALATSFTLNLIAQKFFGIPIKKEGKKVEHLIQSIDRMGIHAAPNQITSNQVASNPVASNPKQTLTPTQETCESFFKDISLPPESEAPIGPDVVPKEILEEKKEIKPPMLLKI